MNKPLRIAVAAAFGVAFAIPAFAQSAAQPETTGPDVNASQSNWRHYGSKKMYFPRDMTESSDRFGSPAGDLFYDREIRLGSNPGSIGVTHGETVKFVMSDGREFRWRFDTLKRVSSFPLARIAPSDMSVSQNANVYVNGDDSDMKG